MEVAIFKHWVLGGCQNIASRIQKKLSAVVSDMGHWVLGGCQKFARRILKKCLLSSLTCRQIWLFPLVNGWLAKKKKKKTWSHSIEKETLLGDALIPSSTALALLGFASSSYMQRSQFQNDFLICISCSCERAFVKNDEQVLAGTPRVLICCKCS